MIQIHCDHSTEAVIMARLLATQPGLQWELIVAGQPVTGPVLPPLAARPVRRREPTLPLL